MNIVLFQSSVVITPGTVARITTGAPLPRGADAVVMVENTKLVMASDDVCVYIIVLLCLSISLSLFLSLSLSVTLSPSLFLFTV